MPMPDDAEFEAIYQRVMDRWIAAGDLSKLSADEQDFIAITTLLNENANGSLSQYFENSYGDFAARAVRALERIECREARDCVSEAMALLEGGASAEQSRRGEQLQAISDFAAERLYELSERLESEASRVWKALARHAARWTV